MQIYNIELGDKDKYDLIKFPGGELHVRIQEQAMTELAGADLVAITARVTNSDKLIETLLLCDAVRQDTSRPISLILPYLPYGRADRRFSSGDCFGVATFARLVNSATVTPITLDAHSEQGLKYFNGGHDLPSNYFIQQAFDDFSGTASSSDGKASVSVLFPDKGARQRYDAVSRNFENVLHCTKERDLLTGKLKGFKVPELSEFQTKKVLIVDDICDGGGTFNGIADSLKEYGLKIGLYVTHGIFSKGFDKLLSRFERIYTTDSFNTSYADFGPSVAEKLTVYPTQDFFLQHLPKVVQLSGKT